MAARKGAPKTGGRMKGTPNKATADIRDIARRYSPGAMAELGRLATSAESEQARVSAIKEILDRAYGKSIASVEVTGRDGGPIEAVAIVTDDPLEAARQYQRLMSGE